MRKLARVETFVQQLNCFQCWILNYFCNFAGIKKKMGMISGPFNRLANEGGIDMQLLQDVDMK